MIKKFSILLLFSLLLMAFALPAYCSDQAKPSYNGHFGDMDANMDDDVSWEEFKQYFPHAKEKVFKKADIDENGAIDHDEWHEFKDHHGYKCTDE